MMNVLTIVFIVAGTNVERKLHFFSIAPASSLMGSPSPAAGSRRYSLRPVR